MPKAPQLTDEELGKAYRAYEAYNFKHKAGRLDTFDLKRWLRVIRAISPRERPKVNGAQKQPDQKKGWIKQIHQEVTK